jgi:hypothetical protein
MIGTPAAQLLTKLPDLTHHSEIPREVRHNTVHHIKTTPGPLISCPSRHLAPKLIAIAKARFDVMLRRHSAALGWPLVISASPRPQEGQRLAPVRRLNGSKRTH